ncbi:lipocalin family protein [Flavivirga jejuensis]|uniref:Lipocalin family protein n=1 Tax=Flavivirga jejuensis TaxID=870487 RepID=A0ABT8WSY6_9FLAO|nr:lipocalin family protein [Flavivirga jejuensis]MDO5976297.1 lipocalin family protein [Flavivirga jejuensis]
MKKLNILFIALTLILTACSSDDAASPEITESIVGTWKGVSVDYSGTTVTSVEGETINADYLGEAYDVNYSLTFTEDPNNLTSTGTFSVKLTTTVLGQTTTENIENLKPTGDGTWEITDNELIITTDNEEGIMRIMKLTDSELVLAVTEETDLSIGGNSVVSTTDIIVTFEKE